MFLATSATEASKMAFGHFSMIFELGKNGLQLADDFVVRLTNEFASDDPIVFFSYVPFQDDNMERLVDMWSLETYSLHNVNMNDKVIIVADTRENSVCTKIWGIIERTNYSIRCTSGISPKLRERHSENPSIRKESITRYFYWICFHRGVNLEGRQSDC